MISGAAIRAGFGAGVLEDDGGTKNAKCYLCLCVGGDVREMVGRLPEGEEVEMEERSHMGKQGRGKRKGGTADGERWEVGSGL